MLTLSPSDILKLMKTIEKMNYNELANAMGPDRWSPQALIKVGMAIRMDVVEGLDLLDEESLDRLIHAASDKMYGNRQD